MIATINDTLIGKIMPTGKQFDIRDAKSKYFLIRVTATGKMLYVCQYARGKRVNIENVKTMSPAKAREIAKNMMTEYAQGIHPRTKKQIPSATNNQQTIPTLSEFVENDYGPWRIANRKRAEEDIKRFKSHFLKALGNIPLNEISAKDLDKWCTQRILDGIKHDTVNRDVAFLKAALSKAVDWEVLNEHPLRKLKPAKGPDSTRIRYLDHDEEKRLLDAITLRDSEAKEARDRYNEWRKERNYDLYSSLSQCAYSDHMTPMILISLNTGLRQGELFNLNWEQVNLTKRIVSVLGKSNRWRHIPLNNTAFNAFIQWKTQCPNKILVFPGNSADKPFDNVNKAWNTILKKAEIKEFRWHDMRHHFASKLVMAGVDINTVRELLGHADIKMTLRYAHLAPEHKAEAVSKIG